MGAKFLQTLAQYLLIPVLQKLGNYVVEYIKQLIEERKRKKEDAKAIEQARTYEATKPSDNNDAAREFSKLP